MRPALLRPVLIVLALLSVAPAAQAQTSLDSALAKLKACTRQIADGHGVWCKQSTPTSITNKIVEDHSIRITVRYEPRPIGGIVTVTADLIPAFSGIGVQSRPIDSKSTAAAVDALNPDEIDAISKELVADLSRGYAFGSLARTNKLAQKDGIVVIESEYHFSPHTRKGDDGHKH